MEVTFIFGTRPEAIKLAPVILAMKSHPDFTTNICVTGQHKLMLNQVLEVYDIVPNANLNLMQDNQTLGEFTARAMTALDAYLSESKQNFVIVQGDTTTSFVAALAAFYNHIPVAHVEAGLRTGNLQAPWPEEANRVLISRLADLHFTPTELSKINLIKEQVPEDKIFVTGNTVIDALFNALEKVRQNPPVISGLPLRFFSSLKKNNKKLILVTGHRSESFGQEFENICLALRDLAERKDVHIVYPVHLNPNVHEPVLRILGKKTNITLLNPLPYFQFLHLMNKCHFIITDSGGVQEEAPSLKKPVLVMRDTTERPEGVKAETSKLVGTTRNRICTFSNLLLDDSNEYEKMSLAHNPYGDGRAAQRIIDALLTKD